MPENAVRGIEPVRLMNQFGHIINVVEDDDVDASIESHSDEKAHSNNDNDEGKITIKPNKGKFYRLDLKALSLLTIL